MAKIFDTCMFFNEIEMLELRFNILDPVVDYFVVCEAEETHSGQPKRLNFLDNHDRFRQWQNKIIFVNAGELSNGNRNSWQREYYHRSCITQGLHGAQPEDWVIVADCDEIPDPGNVAKLKQYGPSICFAKFELEFFYYDFNHRVDQGWAIGAERHTFDDDPNKIRTCSANTAQPFILDGGWHFSYMGGPDQVLSKIQSFMHHGDIAKDVPRDASWIKQRIDNGLDLYDRDLKITHVPTSDGLPRYVLDHAEKYQAMGWLE